MDDQTDDFISACGDGNLEVVEEILEVPGFDPNNRSDRQFNGLQSACYNGRTQIVSKLLSLPNVDVNVRNEGMNNTLIHLACEENNLDVIRMLLLIPSIDVNARNKDGKTPLFVAVHWDHIEIIKLLIQAGADLSKKNNSGTNILISGCDFGTIKFILDIASPEVALDLMTCPDQSDYSFLDHILYGFQGSCDGIVLLRYFLIKVSLVAKELGVKINIGDERHELLKQYEADPKIIWLWQAETDPISDVFTQVVMLCDNYYCVGTSRFLNPQEKEGEKENPEVVNRKRWFSIVSQLPMELQMLACHRLFDSMKQNVHGRLVTAQMNHCR